VSKPQTGIGIKPDDQYTVPLCGKHHREQHQDGERLWWYNRNKDPIVLSAALFEVSGNNEAGERIIRLHRGGF
jgi:hypothetical protein